VRLSRLFIRGKIIPWYMARLLKGAHHDRCLALAFHQVANLMNPPASVLALGVALRVLRGNLPGLGCVTGRNQRMDEGPVRFHAPPCSCRQGRT
jgi:hypothetical protein